jgi:hypothetical protein
MKIQDLKSKIKTEDFETVCLLIYEAVVDNKITSEQFINLIEEVSKEFDATDEDDFNDDFNLDELDDDFSDYDDEDENY